MSSRNAKKRANEKINVNNANKRACNKQETVDLVTSEDHNDFLNNNITSQSKSTGAKRSYKKKQVTDEPLNKNDNNNDNTQSKCKRGRKNVPSRNGKNFASNLHLQQSI